MTRTIPSTNKLERLLGAVETHSITCAGAALRADVQSSELYLSDCAEALETLRVAVAEVVVSRPCSAESRLASDILRRGMEFHAEANLSNCRAWAKRGGNPRSVAPAQEQT